MSSHSPQPPHDREWLLAELRRRGPWYQRIEFPRFGVATTDDPACVVRDPAWDNLFPGMEPGDAPRLRPQPKYDRLKHLLPSLQNKSVLDVGCSCGFFALEFARLGARAVTGVDIDSNNAARGAFCATILGLPQVRFEAGDIGQYTLGHDVVWGASLHEHFFFPFYYFARLLCLAHEMFILETHHYMADDESNVTRLDVAPTSNALGSHAFHFSRKMYRDFLRLLLVPAEDIEERTFYEDGNVRRLLLCVSTKRFQQRRAEHPYLRVLDDVGVATAP